MIFIQPSINPIILSLGFIDIRWYSLAYIFTFIIGSVLIKKLNQNSYKLLSNHQIDKIIPIKPPWKDIPPFQISKM